MVWARTDLLLSPVTMSRLVAEGKACLGSGPRGFTFTRSDGVTRRYQIVAVLPDHFVCLTWRRWV